MTEDIKNLIEKINQEGIQAAEAKAKAIEDEVRIKAGEILSKAKEEATQLINEAGEKIARMEEKEKTALAQAGRDLLLSLRREINAMLMRIIGLDVRRSLSPEAMYKIILELIKSFGKKQGQDIVITLKKEDLEALEHAFLAKLKEETQNAVILKPSEDILGGFTVSFDSGKSQFDFTDHALAEYIGNYLKPKLNEILREALKG